MLHTLVSAEVKTSTRGSQYAILLYKVNPDDKLECPKKVVLFDKNIISLVLSGNIPNTEDIVETVFPLNGKYLASNGVIVDHVTVRCILIPQYEMTDSGVKYVGKTFAKGMSPQEIAERMKNKMIKL